jgi:hypothetical protein
MTLWPTKQQWRRWSLPSKAGFIGSLASLLGLAIAGVTLLLGGWSISSSPRNLDARGPAAPPAKSARVVFVDNRLVLPPNGSGPVTISFGLMNTGNADAVVTIWDRTYFFSTHSEQTEFPFVSSPSEEVQVPAIANAVVRGEMRYEFAMTAEKLDALNAGKARLLFYARGQYTDESNTVHGLPFSAVYDATFPGNLIAVPKGIVFQ